MYVDLPSAIGLSNLEIATTCFIGEQRDHDAPWQR
jgi:hypothetical protein